MLLLGYTLAAVAFMLPVHHERSTARFDLTACSAHATDIVVTDRDGRVRECWRGELKPGDVVRLGAEGLTPANALPWGCSRLRPERTVSGIYYSRPNGWRYFGCREFLPDSALPDPVVWPLIPEAADTELRLVLFLRREGTSGAGAIWVPAATPPRYRMEFDAGWRGSTYLGGPRPMPPFRMSGALGDCTTSIAWAEAGRVVAQHCGQLVPIALTLAHFKADALANPGPPANPLKWDAPPPVSGVSAEAPAARILSGGLR